MPWRLEILWSISLISTLAMFFRIPSISNSCISDDRSFLSLCSPPRGLSGVRGTSSIIFRPLDTLLLCFLPSSLSSGKEAWKPWNSEYEFSWSGMFSSISSERYDKARLWISVVENLDRTMSVGVVLAMENMLRWMPGRFSCLCTSAMALW